MHAQHLSAASINHSPRADFCFRLSFVKLGMTGWTHIVDGIYKDRTETGHLKGAEKQTRSGFLALGLAAYSIKIEGLLELD